MIYEVRDYHYRPDLLAEYKAWAEEAVQVLRRQLDVVGFWIDDGDAPAEIHGNEPFESPLGSANITWIIRWESKAARDAAQATVFDNDEWNAVFAKNPDPGGYRQISARFMHAL